MANDLSSLRALEEVEYVRNQWLEAEKMMLEKRYPEGFPALPELPLGRYTDREFFEIEKEYMWKRTWILVGFANEVPDPGSFKAIDVLGHPVILARDKAGEIRAFHNVCKHRGAKVCQTHTGVAANFRCPYHSWTYDLEGKLIFVPDEHEFPGLDKSTKSLSKLRCERLGNLIFVCFDLNARPLTEFFSGISDLMADVPFDRVALHDTLQWDIDCNWKCGHDAFVETYHVKFIHPQTANKTLDGKRVVRYLFGNGHVAMIVKNRGDAHETVFRKKETSEALKQSDANVMKPLTHVAQRAYNLFPSITMVAFENVFSIIQILPVAAGKCQMKVYIVKILGNTEVDLDQLADEAVIGFKPIMEEDVFNIAQMHASMSSGASTTIPLSFGEHSIHHYHQVMDEVIGAERVPEHLRVTRVELPLVHR
ncbi:MAG TPA: SRPBCC family protein [Vicinamibacterales bacterium]|nr:SRPBCC family protein [Vicinamibacterales bacterium]